MFYKYSEVCYKYNLDILELLAGNLQHQKPHWWCQGFVKCIFGTYLTIWVQAFS